MASVLAELAERSGLCDLITPPCLLGSRGDLPVELRRVGSEEVGHTFGLAAVDR